MPKQEAKKSSRRVSKPSISPPSAGAEVQPQPTPESERGFTTYSIRLDEQQRDWLLKAAALRGWTPTQLIRTATVDASRHILNTARLTRFNFKALANEIASHLFDVGIEYATNAAPNGDLSWEPYDSFDQTAPCSIRIQPEPMPVNRLLEIRQAARLGGAEFLNMIVDFCDALTAPRRNDVPDPIEASKTDAEV